MTFDTRYINDNQKSVFIVVSGVAAGIGIAPALKGYGYEVIHITSRLQKNLGYIHNSIDYIKSFEETEDLSGLIKEIKNNWQIKGIIPGAEAGVDLAETLNDVFNLESSNDFNLSHTRRNKYNMHVALKNSGVLSMEQHMAENLNDIYSWQVDRNVSFPIVLKPLDSAGTDNVFICHSKAEIIESFNKIKTSTNIFKELNTKVLCQEYILGQEYMVNTISWAGEHRIIEIFKIDKKEVKNKPLHDIQILLHPQEEDFKLINAYIEQVYNALGIKYGAAHTEVKIGIRNKLKCVTLIEVATRLGGAASPSALQEVQGFSQLSALVSSYVNHSFLKSIPKDGIIPTRDLATVYFNSPVSGIMRKNVDFDFFKKLKTYHCMRFNPIKDEMLELSQDLMSIPGYVYLVGKQADIQKDIKLIRSYEKEMYNNLLYDA